DTKGLTALWREGLLARAVLHGRTKGYTSHPQLIRFRAHPAPLKAIDAYLFAVLAESRHRGYHFDASKIDASATALPIEETTGQLEYEWRHLLNKLCKRAPDLWKESQGIKPKPHPLFTIINGTVREWEKVAQ
ncbi:MAG: pyrimidine dimer DNA glycosylase/endonuclease V, partial [Desulfobacterales bacterium]